MRRLLKAFIYLLFIGNVPCVPAIECATAVTIVENTICDSPQLIWLDTVMNNARLKAVREKNWQNASRSMTQWQQLRDACTSESCLRWAYLQEISQLYQTPKEFNWDGEWWNSTAAHGDGARLILSGGARWGFDFDAQVWAGVYRLNLRGPVKMVYGVGLADAIAWGGQCRVLFIPRPDGAISVTSDGEESCKLLLRGGVALDGVYVRSQGDPRPQATLLSLGILPSEALDQRFRQLAKEEYRYYVENANKLVYAEDLDALNATVVMLTQKGAANRQAAIIMFTPAGQIWAMRLLPAGKQKEGLTAKLISTEGSEKALPETLVQWKRLFEE